MPKPPLMPPTKSPKRSESRSNSVRIEYRRRFASSVARAPRTAEPRPAAVAAPPRNALARRGASPLTSADRALMDVPSAKAVAKRAVVAARGGGGARGERRELGAAGGRDERGSGVGGSGEGGCARRDPAARSGEAGVASSVAIAVKLHSYARPGSWPRSKSDETYF